MTRRFGFLLQLICCCCGVRSVAIVKRFFSYYTCAILLFVSNTPTQVYSDEFTETDKTAKLLLLNELPTVSVWRMEFI